MDDNGNREGAPPAAWSPGRRTALARGASGWGTSPPPPPGPADARSTATAADPERTVASARADLARAVTGASWEEHGAAGVLRPAGNVGGGARMGRTRPPSPPSPVSSPEAVLLLREDACAARLGEVLVSGEARVAPGTGAAHGCTPEAAAPVWVAPGIPPTVPDIEDGPNFRGSVAVRDGLGAAGWEVADADLADGARWALGDSYGSSSVNPKEGHLVGPDGAPGDDLTLGSGAAAGWLTPGSETPAPGIPPTARRAKRKKAHILKNGELSLIPYGADERLLWARRVAAFQKDVRAVLGDRRRTREWGGSVLDSLVGVLLTQNVSDTLSSNAFMHVAARWPKTKLDRGREGGADEECREQGGTGDEAHGDGGGGGQRGGEGAGPGGAEVATPPASGPLRRATRASTQASTAASAAAARLPRHAKAPRAELGGDAAPAAPGAAGGGAVADGGAQPGEGSPSPPLPIPKTPAGEDPPRVAVVDGEGVGRRRGPRTPSPAATTCVDDHRVDIVDWEAVRLAPTSELEEAIKCRGMQTMLAPRIQQSLEYVRESNLSRLRGEKPSAIVEATEARRLAAEEGRVWTPGGPQGANGKVLRKALMDSARARERERAAAATGRPGIALSGSPPGALGRAEPGSPRGMGVAAATPLAPAASFPDPPPLLVATPLPPRGEHVSTRRLSRSLADAFDAAAERAAAEVETEAAEVETEAAEVETEAAEVETEAARVETEAASARGSGTATSPAPPSAGARERAGASVTAGLGGSGASSTREEAGELPASERSSVEGDGPSSAELLSLEWLRTHDPGEVVDFLLGIDGIGLKSVACLTLLTLSGRDFPVDVNVGRITARLGWLPLDSELAVEDTDEYAPEPEVHQYLRKRLHPFGHSTLYELHYQMITLGKIFCHKKAPNCEACPLEATCEYAQHRKSPEELKLMREARRLAEERAQEEEEAEEEAAAAAKAAAAAGEKERKWEGARRAGGGVRAGTGVWGRRAAKEEEGGEVAHGRGPGSSGPTISRAGRVVRRRAFGEDEGASGDDDGWALAGVPAAGWGRPELGLAAVAPGRRPGRPASQVAWIPPEKRWWGGLGFSASSFSSSSIDWNSLPARLRALPRQARQLIPYELPLPTFAYLPSDGEDGATSRRGPSPDEEAGDSSHRASRRAASHAKRLNRDLFDARRSRRVDDVLSWAPSEERPRRAARRALERGPWGSGPSASAAAGDVSGRVWTGERRSGGAAAAERGDGDRGEAERGEVEPEAGAGWAGGAPAEGAASRGRRATLSADVGAQGVEAGVADADRWLAPGPAQTGGSRSCGPPTLPAAAEGPGPMEEVELGIAEGCDLMEGVELQIDDVGGSVEVVKTTPSPTSSLGVVTGSVEVGSTGSPGEPTLVASAPTWRIGERPLFAEEDGEAVSPTRLDYRAPEGGPAASAPDASPPASEAGPLEGPEPPEGAALRGHSRAPRAAAWVQCLEAARKLQSAIADCERGELEAAGRGWSYGGDGPGDWGAGDAGAGGGGSDGPGCLAGAETGGSRPTDVLPDLGTGSDSDSDSDADPGPGPAPPPARFGQFVDVASTLSGLRARVLQAALLLLGCEESDLPTRREDAPAAERGAVPGQAAPRTSGTPDQLTLQAAGRMFRRLAAVTHPDKNDDPRAREVFEASAKANAVVREACRREEAVELLQGAGVLDPAALDVSPERALADNLRALSVPIAQRSRLLRLTALVLPIEELGHASPSWGYARRLAERRSFRPEDVALFLPLPVSHDGELAQGLHFPEACLEEGSAEADVDPAAADPEAAAVAADDPEAAAAAADDPEAVAVAVAHPRAAGLGIIKREPETAPADPGTAAAQRRSARSGPRRRWFEEAEEGQDGGEEARAAGATPPPRARSAEAIAGPASERNGAALPLGLAAVPPPPTSSGAHAPSGAPAGAELGVAGSGSAPRLPAHAAAGGSRHPPHATGLVLIPHYVALGGKFPLNATYFQTNEAFLDRGDDYSAVLVDPSALRGRVGVPVFLGHSIHFMSRNMTLQDVSTLFHRGVMCCRGWLSHTGSPALLPQWLMPSPGAGKPTSTWKSKATRDAERDAKLREAHAAALTAWAASGATGPRPVLELLPPWRGAPKARAASSLAARRAAVAAAGHASGPGGARAPRQRPSFPKAPKCGVCAACLNPHWKKPCEVRRAQAEEWAREQRLWAEGEAARAAEAQVALIAAVAAAAAPAASPLAEALGVEGAVPPSAA